MRYIVRYLPTFGSMLLKIVALALVALLWACHNPVSQTKMYRRVFDREVLKMNRALESRVPEGIAVLPDEHYDPEDEDAWLDLYYPERIAEDRRGFPTIIWVHGGAWIAGDKNDVSNYYKILAARGYTVAAVNYSLAPGKVYPTPVRQVNRALAYLIRNARRLHVDTQHLILAGNSGGAHIVVQLANLASDPDYAARLGIEPLVQRQQLYGLILYCGPYDIDSLKLEGRYGKLLRTALRSYSGSEDFKDDPQFASASVIDYLTKNFPPAFVSAGNGDPLASQSHALAGKLARMGVPVETLFIPATYTSGSPREYQFNLDSEAGRLALERSLAFLARYQKGRLRR